MIENTEKHSEAYNEIINIINAASYHRKHCKFIDCNVSLFLLRQSAKKLMHYLNEKEHADIITRIDETNWM